MASTPIRFLVDENAPQSVGDALVRRGHDVLYVGEHFAKSTPDPLLVAAAEIEGLVVITFDKDFKRLVKQVPHGIRGSFGRRAGRISLNLEETQAQGRIEELAELIEVYYQFALLRNQRFIMQISLTSFTVSG
jgi:hypothetical protein